VLREPLEERVEGGLPVQVEVEALGQGGGLGWPAHPVEVPDVVDVVLPGEPGVERDVAGDVADTSVQVVAVRPRVEADSSALPAVARVRPMTMRSVVVLPAPLGPR